MAYNMQGHSYGQLGEHKNAIFNFTKAIQLDPDNAMANKAGGLLFGISGKDDLSNKDFD